MKRTLRRILCIGLILAVLVYLVMFLDTNSVKKQVEDAFMWRVDPSETKGRAINWYNYSVFQKSVELGSANLRLVRLFVWHNFKEGYIWAVYSYQAYDPEGNLITASHLVPTKWKIHKENSQWEIVEIFENG